MAISLNTNIASLNAQNKLNSNSDALSKSLQRLSSGLRINSAADDAAGLAISSRLSAQISGMSVASRNTNDAISMLQTADGALSTGSDILQRMRDLALQASNATVSDDDLGLMDVEYQDLTKELTRVAGASFNGITMVGAKAGTFSFQIGANSGDTLDVTTKDMSQYLATPGDLTSKANAGTALTAIDAAMKSLNTDRASYGSSMNRLGNVVNGLADTTENLTSAKSRIMDVDFAAETANMSRLQILQQAGASILAQANQSPQMVLSLLR